MYKEINRNTKLARYYINRYIDSEYKTLNDCYKTYSEYKRRAYNYCYEQFKKDNGKEFRIISFNFNFFSIAYLTRKGLIIETPTNSYIIKDMFLSSVINSIKKNRLYIWRNL